MDLAQVLSVLRLSWDLPWRILASVAALSTSAGLVVGVTAVGFLALCSDWLGLDAAFSTALLDAQIWIAERGAILATIGAILLIAALVFAGAEARRGSGRRAPATALIGAALAVESGYPIVALGAIVFVLALWLITLIWRAILGYTSDFYIGDHPVALAESRLRRTWLSLIIAAVYVPLAPIAWMTR